MPEKYKLYVYFDNGEHGLLDLASLKNKGVFEMWEHGDRYFQAFINPQTGAITWPGDIDICPDNTYFKTMGLNPEDFMNPI